MGFRESANAPETVEHKYNKYVQVLVSCMSFWPPTDTAKFELAS